MTRWSPRMLALLVLLWAVAPIVPGTSSPAEAAAPKKGSKKGAKGAVAKKKGKGKVKAGKPGKTPEEIGAEKAMYEGGLAYEDGETEKAIVLFERARELSPVASGPYKALGYSYLKLDRLDDAREAFEGFLKYTKTDAGRIEAENSIAAIDVKLEAIEDEKAATAAAAAEAAKPKKASKPVATATDAKTRGGVTPLGIAGFAWAGAGAAALGVGVVFTVQLFNARAAFAEDFDAVRPGLTIVKGGGTSLHVCNDDDFAQFTEASQEMLGPAREHCGGITLRHVLVPTLLGAGALLMVSGVLVGVVTMKPKSDGDPYSMRPSLRLGFSPLPGGGYVGLGGSF